MAFFFRLPPLFSSRSLFVIAAVFLFNCCCCCHANEDALKMNKFACAKDGAQIQGFTVQGNSIAMDSDGINANAIFFGYLTNKNDGKLSIRMAVDDSCTNAFSNYVFFQTGDKKCEKKPATGGTKCPETIPKCKFFTVSCAVQMKEVVDFPDAGVFKVDLKNFVELKKVCKWKGFVEGVRLVLDDSEDANGEPCIDGGIALWLIVAVAGGGVLFVLVLIVVIVCVIKGRSKEAAQPAGGPMGILSSWKSFAAKSFSGPKPMVGRSKADRSGVKVPGTVMGGTTMGLVKAGGSTSKFSKTADGGTQGTVKTSFGANAASAGKKTSNYARPPTALSGTGASGTTGNYSKAKETAPSAAEKPKQGSGVYGIL